MRNVNIDYRRPVSTLLASLVLLLAASPFVSHVQGQTDGPPGFQLRGDFRLRYERTANQEPGTPLLETRTREVVRFRAGFTKKLNELLQVGARLATGSLDDPNTADVTLGDFLDDLEVNLDRVYLELTYQDIFLTGGKFANPFLRTDLVWDGDVNPQGAAGSYTFSGSGQIIPKLTGIYSIIDEHARTATPDSYMWGGQLEVVIQPVADWRLTVAGAYYDYSIQSLSNADAGDTRSNNLTADGTAYISDFDLLDAIAMVEYRGLGERYPIRFVADYVKNLGAEVDEDRAFTVDLYIGRPLQTNDLRFHYGYAEAGTDAVLAAFSNDNTTIATNYVQHTLGIDYVALQNTTLNMTWYLYRRKQLDTGAATVGKQLVSRLRLNVTASF